MKANATCQRCGVRYYLAPNEPHEVTCDHGPRRKKCGGSVVRDGRELLVGVYVRRRDGLKCRVVRLDGTRTYFAYVDGKLAYEGSRAGAMDRAL